MAKTPARRSGRRSWRQQGSSEAPAPTSRTAGRIFSSVLLLVLVALFVIFLPRGCGGTRHLDLVAILEYDRLALAPMPFVPQDVERMQTIEKFTGIVPRLELTDQSLSEFTKSLSDRSIETLVIYVSAHGLSANGTPVLACSDFSVGGRGRYEIRKLFNDIQKSPARMKLILLDTQRIASDPRLGMVVNEFPRLVAEELAGRDKNEELWVLLSAAPFQLSAASYVDRRSVFGMAVEEALAGRADEPQEAKLGSDGNEDKLLTLYELYHYLLARCGNWHQDPLIRQTPILLRSGVGFVSLKSEIFQDTTNRYEDYAIKAIAPPEEEESSEESEPEPDEDEQARSNATGRWPSASSLALLQRKSDDEEETGATEDAGESDADEEEAAADEKTADGESGEEKPKKAAKRKKKKADDSEPAAAAGKTERLARMVEEGWQLRDALQTRATRTERTPIDFAPHLWREVEAVLLFFEQRCLGGFAAGTGADEDSADAAEPAETDVPPAATFEDLEQLVNGLRELQEAMATGRPPQVTSRNRERIENRLLAAWNRYQRERGAEDTKFDTQENSFVVDFKASLRRFHDLAYAAPYYVRWHARASRFTTSELPHRDAIADYLTQLKTFQGAIQNLERSDVTEYSEDDDLNDLDGELDLREVQDRKDEIDELIDNTREGALSGINERVNRVRLVQLLSTPLLSAPERSELVQAFLRLGTEPTRIYKRDPPSVDGLDVKLDQWQLLLGQLALEQQLVDLVDVTVALKLEALLEGINDRISGAYDQGVEARVWEECRQLGIALEKLYGELPKRVSEAAGPDEVGFSDLTLHLVDPRDEVSRYAYVRFLIKPQLKPILRIALAEEQAEEVVLKADQEQKVVFELRATREELLGIPLEAEYDRNVLQVRQSGGFGSTEKRAGWYYKPVVFYVSTGAAQKEARRSALVVVRPTSPDVQCEPKRIDCVLPRPNRLDLVAKRDGRENAEPEDADTVRLRLFPGHKTFYYLSLMNQSDDSKRVQVDLFAIPEMPGRTLAPGRISRRLKDYIYNTSGTLHPRVEEQRIGHIKELVLGGNGGVEPLSFLRPAEEKPETPEGKDEAKKEPPAPPVAELPADISRGLVCVVSDLENPDERPWVKWIEFERLHPRHYLREEIGYDPNQRRIVARLVPRPGEDGRPDLPNDGEPVTVEWDTSDVALEQIPDAASKRLTGQIEGVDQEMPPLYVEALPDDVQRFVRLRVDGCPRAFVSRVDCKRSAANLPFLEGKPIRRDLNDILVTAIREPTLPEVYYPPPYVSWPEEPAELPKDSPGHDSIPLKVKEPAVFRDTRTLRVYFRSDARDDAFLRERDSIEIYMGGDKKATLYSDRRIAAQVVAFRPRGRLDLDLTMEDHFVDFDPGETNVQSFIYAAIVLDGRTRSESPRIPLILDSARPTVVGDVDFPQVIAKGSDGSASVRFNDISPIGEVRSAILEEEPLSLNSENSKRARFAVRDNLLSFKVATRELKPGTHTLWTQIWDRAGWKSDPVGHDFRVVEVTAKPGTPQGPAKGTIRGSIVLAGSRRRVNGIFFRDNVELLKGEELMPNAVKVEGDGTFVIKDVPAGTYTIRASGFSSNQEVAGAVKRVFTFRQPVETVTVGVKP